MDPRLASQVDGALGYLNDVRALILDLRETQAGGRHDVAEALATRLAAAAPRTKLAVLVDPWTAGEGEALAGALQGSAGAALIGTRTAGLHADLKEARLPHSGIAVRFPVRRGEALRPDLKVDLAAPSGGPGDPILYQALKSLAPSPARGDRSAPR
jgi:hypothetical protein